jgi:hypothetical protein
MATSDRQKLIRQFMKKNSKPPPSDVRSGNPRMGKYAGKAGYAIPYSDDTSRSPYKPGARGRRPRKRPPFVA